MVRSRILGGESVGFKLFLSLSVLSALVILMMQGGNGNGIEGEGSGDSGSANHDPRYDDGSGNMCARCGIRPWVIMANGVPVCGTCVWYIEPAYEKGGYRDVPIK